MFDALTPDALATDRDPSKRIKDTFGRLHVRDTNISKANVCGYRGSEIPNGKALGLEPDRLYQLYRDPTELAKAADSFNNIQLLSRHVAVDAEHPQKQAIAGSTGTDAVFIAPYLRNSLVIWNQPDIEDVESGEKVELSCSYAYKAVMEPGVAPDGTPYDGRMIDIVGNHVAICVAGRAGPDVLVADETLPIPVSFNLETSSMTISALSGKAQLAHGALAAWLPPKLAKDAKIDLKAVLTGTTAGNWPQAKTTIVKRLKEACTGKLAKDASLDEVTGLLDRLDGEMPDMAGEDEEEETAEEKAKRLAQRASDKAAKDWQVKHDAASPEERERMMEERRASDRASARDADPTAESEEEYKARMDARRAKDKKGRDEETPEQRAEREKAEKAEDMKAMDEKIAAATKTAEQNTLARLNGVREAERVARPWIGDLVMAQDSAEDVYRFALTTLGVKVDGVHPSAFRAVLEAQPKPGAAPHRIAMDAAASKSFAERYPEATRIRSV